LKICPKNSPEQLVRRWAASSCSEFAVATISSQI